MMRNKKPNMNIKLLEDIGLTKSEIKVYLALLELGSATSGPIVEKSGASSSKIYEILEKLMQKGLVSFIIKAGTKHFEAASPERLLDYINEKESALTAQKQELRSLIPELELRKKLREYKSEATIFKGIKGVETAYNDILKTMKSGEEYYVFGAMEPTEPYFTFIQHYHKKRAAKGIRVKLLYSKSVHELAAKIKELPHTEIKFSPPQLVASSFVVMYKDKTLITVGTKKDLTLFRIENKEVTESFRSQFNILWNQDTTVSKGMKTLIETLNSFIDEIKPGDTFDALGTAFGIEGEEEKYAEAFGEFHRYRLQKGIKARWLFQQGSLPMIEKNKQNYDRGEIKFLPYKTESPVAIHPYKGRTLLVIQGKEPTVITINNKEVTESFHKHFESVWNQEVKVLKGMEAVKNLYEDMLQYGSVDFIGARGYFVDLCPKKYIDDWERRAIKAGFVMRNIVDPEVKGKRNTTFPFAQTKYTLPIGFSDLSVFWMYGNKVVITNWVEKEPLTIIIENKNIYKMYKTQFEMLWKQETQTLRGLVGIKQLCDEVINSREDLYLIGANGVLYERHNTFFNEFDKKRIERGIKRHHLSIQTKRNAPFNTLPQTEARYLPKEFNSPMVIWIFGDNVATILWDEEVIYLTKNQKIADDYRKYFQLLWKSASA